VFQLETKDAINFAATSGAHHRATLSVAHHPVLGIVTADSFANKDAADTSSIADNPPVSGSAGGSDPHIGAEVAAMRAAALPFGSQDRGFKGGKTSGAYDIAKTDDVAGGPQGVLNYGIAARIAARFRR
jgi:hypothetical protein